MVTFPANDAYVNKPHVLHLGNRYLRNYMDADFCITIAEPLRHTTA